VPTDRRPSQLRRIGAAATMTLVVVAALVGAAGTAVAASVKRMSNADIAPTCAQINPSRFCTDKNGTAGTATVVDDQRANAGRGYLRLSTPTSADHVTVFSQALTNHKLSEISDLAFETYVEKVGTDNNQIAPSINIPIFPNKAGIGFSTLVWEPTYTGAGVVKPGQWQTWRPSTSKGGWWATRTTLDGTKANEFGFVSYAATFDEIKALLPDAVVLGVGINQGTGSTGLIAGVDQLKVNDTTYDFENPAPTADLGVKITAPPTAVPGSKITVRVTVTNGGPSPARDINTALIVGGGVHVLQAQGGFWIGGVATFRSPTLDVGTSLTYDITLTVDNNARGPLSVLAAAHSAVPDPKPLDNVVRTTVPVASTR